MPKNESQPKVGWAGLSSVDLANVMEPPIQRKRKPDVVQSADAGEYILLGEQGKFAQNVKYKVKDAPVFVKPQLKAPKSPPLAPRASKPAPKVVVDMGAPQHKSIPQKPILKHNAGTQADNSEDSTKVMKQSSKFSSLPKAQSNKENVRPSALKPSQSAGAPKHSESKQLAYGPPRKEMNEVVQTDMTRGVADSEPSAPANYAMAYRAGVAPKRPKSLKRNSEYQSRFQWKDPVGSSPMLAAEQIVYNSNPNMGFAASDIIPKTTEYRLQFQPWASHRSDEQDSEMIAKAAAEARKQKMKRSKSVDSALRLKPAGVPSGLIDSTQQKAERLKTVMNPQGLHFPHGKQKSHCSEYHNNFKAPSDFVYSEGAWKGANPPHLNQVQSVSKSLPAESTEQTADMKAQSWFREVTELRSRALEYRRRARGTHFSREHLAQLYAQQAQLWDSLSVEHMSESQSSIAALSLEATPRSTQSEPPTTPHDSASKASWSDEQSDITLSSRESRHDSRPKPSVASASSSEGGRVPTPKVHHTPASANYTRHHLDRTTPAIGGAILTSPPKGHRPASTRSSVTPESSVRSSTPTKSKLTSTIAGQVNDPTMNNEVKCTCGAESNTPSPVSSTHNAPSSSHIAVDSTQVQRNLSKVPVSHYNTTTPTLGMPTHDSHVLLDDTRSLDEPLQTQYMHTPLIDPPGRREIWQLKHPDLSIPTTVLEQTEQSRVPVDDDVLSVSAVSVASSASLASEVLERAKHRRDQFWK